MPRPSQGDEMKNSELFNGPLGEDRQEFTDDDLKRLKETNLKAHYYDVTYPFDVEDIIGLIARLEAAEKANAMLLLVCQDDRQSYEYSEGVLSQAEDAMEAWRAAAGKS